MERKVSIEKREEFRKELTVLINKYGLENACDTPDYILADLLVGAYDNYSLHVTRRDNWFGFDPFNQSVDDKTDGEAAPVEQENAEPENTEPETEEAEDVKSEAGFIVYKHVKKNEFSFFVEWRHGIPVFAEDENLAMLFEYKGMAEHVASCLGDGWQVYDLDEVRDEEECRKCENLLKAIFGEDDPADPDKKSEFVIPKGSRFRVRGIIVEERKAKSDK